LKQRFNLANFAQSEALADIVFCLSVALCHFFLVGIFEEADLQAIANFDVDKPFAFRVLIPFIARQIAFVLGLTVSAWVFLFIEIASVYSLLKVLRRLYLINGEAERVSALKSRLGILAVLIPLNAVTKGPLFYPWDIPASLFILLSLLLSLRDRTFLFILTFVVACANRETAFVMPIIYSLMAKKASIRKRFFVLISCSMFFTCWRLLIEYVFRSSPGPSVFWKYGDSLTIASNLEFVMRNPFFVLCALLFLPVIVAIRFRSLPSNLKLLTLPICLLLAASMIGGIASESRVFLEAFCLMYFLASVSNAGCGLTTDPNNLPISR
jgi:hypothetical protein